MDKKKGWQSYKIIRLYGVWELLMMIQARPIPIKKG